MADTKENRNFVFALIISGLLHAGLFYGGNLLTNKVQFNVMPSVNSPALNFIPSSSMSKTKVFPDFINDKLQVDVNISDQIKEEFLSSNKPAVKMNKPAQEPQMGALEHLGAEKVVEATAHYNPAPVYPQIARENGWEGLVVAQVTVTPKGNIEDAVIENSSGYAVLDNAVITALKYWRFNPAQLEGRPVKSTVTIPIEFNLEDSML